MEPGLAPEAAAGLGMAVAAGSGGYGNAREHVMEVDLVGSLSPEERAKRQQR